MAVGPLPYCTQVRNAQNKYRDSVQTYPTFTCTARTKIFNKTR